MAILLTRVQRLVSYCIHPSYINMLPPGGREGGGYLRTARLGAESSCQASASSTEFLSLFRPPPPPLGYSEPDADESLFKGSDCPQLLTRKRILAPPSLPGCFRQQAWVTLSVGLFLPPSWFRAPFTVSCIFPATLYPQPSAFRAN